jgi:hypothetical protein
MKGSLVWGGTEARSPDGAQRHPGPVLDVLARLAPRFASLNAGYSLSPRQFTGKSK